MMVCQITILIQKFKLLNEVAKYDLYYFLTEYNSLILYLSYSLSINIMFMYSKLRLNMLVF
jgi:hypothetical protein